MSDGSLSQDEIDALLQGTDDITGDMGFDSGSTTMGTSVSSPLSQSEISSFQNILNSAASNEGEALGAMVGRNVVISNPQIEIVQVSDLQNQLPEEIVEVKMDYDTGIAGEHNYIFDIETAKQISNLMMGQEGGDLTEASLSALSEAMNTISGNASTTIGNQIKKEIRTAPPITEKNNKNNITLTPSNQFVKVVYNFNIEGNQSKLYEIFGINVVKEIVSSVMPATNDMPGFGQQMGGNQQNMGMNPNMGMQQGMGMNPNMGMQQGMGMNPNMGMQQGMGMNPNMGMGQTPPQVQSVQFSNFNDFATDNQSGNINLLMDVTMDLTVELGRTKKSIKYILGMGEGTVLELDKLAGEPVDILVNGKLIARGEVVVIDENFGVRVTEIISPADRIQELT